MDIVTAPPDAAEWSAQARRRKARVGFVPTMGALHEGHLDLVHRAKAECGVVACSIFVNPLQFNNPEDLKLYPRRPEEDRALLERAGCDLLFAPEKESIFLDFTPITYELGGLDAHWEGPSRPGHFQGVVNVVERLFFFTRPDRAYFGEKDRQQLTIIRHVGRKHHWPETIVPCPTVRDADGLALSSRNLRLDPGQRRIATVLHRSLREMQAHAFNRPVADVRQAALEVLATEPTVGLDYLGIAHPETLAPVQDWTGLDQAVALIAAQVGPVRLIDNITLFR